MVELTDAQIDAALQRGNEAVLSEPRGGYSLHWEAVDADMTVASLLAGPFGTRSNMLGWRAGRHRRQMLQRRG
jgi:hypothetical protein